MNVPTQPERLLTVDELARRLYVGHEKVRELAREGRIPCLRIGRTARFNWDEVVAALRAEAIDGNADQDGAA